MLNGISRPIYIATEPVDMRKSFDGCVAARAVCSCSLRSIRHVKPTMRIIGRQCACPATDFVFINRCADRMKVLYFDNDGYALWSKRLESGRFRLPVAIVGEGQAVAQVSAAQLAMILEGIEPVVVRKRKRFVLKNTA